jgi:hypothetical protein
MAADEQAIHDSVDYITASGWRNKLCPHQGLAYILPHSDAT